MNAKQHNLNPVERPLVASGLCGVSGQLSRTEQGFVEPAAAIPSPSINHYDWPEMGFAAGGAGRFGLSADQPGTALPA